jgi:predicted thioesterase
MRVRAHAQLMRMDKRTLYFDVYAEDEKERIGGGVHERIVINLAKFDARMQDKLNMIRPV